MVHHDGAEGTADGTRTDCKNGIPSQGSGPAPHISSRGYYRPGEKDSGGSGPGARSSRHPAAFSLGRLIYADENRHRIGPRSSSTSAVSPLNDLARLFLRLMLDRPKRSQPGPNPSDQFDRIRSPLVGRHRREALIERLAV